MLLYSHMSDQNINASEWLDAYGLWIQMAVISAGNEALNFSLQKRFAGWGEGDFYKSVALFVSSDV